jgi:hypothetical protein
LLVVIAWVNHGGVAGDLGGRSSSGQARNLASNKSEVVWLWARAIPSSYNTDECNLNDWCRLLRLEFKVLKYCINIECF